MVRVEGKSNLGSWRASYLADRFNISVGDARTLKVGGTISVPSATAKRLVKEGFGTVTEEAAPKEVDEDVVD